MCGFEALDERDAALVAHGVGGTAVVVAQGDDGRVVGALLAGQPRALGRRRRGPLSRALAPLSRAWWTRTTTHSASRAAAASVPAVCRIRRVRREKRSGRSRYRAPAGGTVLLARLGPFAAVRARPLRRLGGPSEDLAHVLAVRARAASQRSSSDIQIQRQGRRDEAIGTGHL